MKRKDGKIIIENPEDLPITPMSLGSTRINKTGSWKYLEPYYQDLTPPCMDRCLVGNDIVTWMRFIQDGDFEGAARYTLEYNPFPAVLGRVCPHPCEQPCNRKAMGGAVQIQSVERFIGDYILEHNIMPEVPEATEAPVAVVGGGPAGLSAAYFLRMLGHSVTVYEKEDRIGGLLWSGIPPYRMPRQVLEQELQRIPAMGITIELGHALGREVRLRALRKEFAAVVLAVGLSKSRSLGIPGEEHPQVLDGVKFLRAVHRGAAPSVDQRVVVVGGGNTAIDCARTLLRLGRQVTLVYRRSRTEMPAFKEEVEQALEEGVKIEFLTQPVRVLTEGDRVTGIECVKMRLGERDASGRRRPIPVEGSEFVMECDAVVKALGEVFDPSVLDDALEGDRSVPVDETGRTPVDGIYAIGDCTGSGGTVAEAIRMGRWVAHHIHRDLTGVQLVEPDPIVRRGASREIAKFKIFNRAYFQVEAPVQPPVRPPEARVGDFEEIVGGLDAEGVQAEARRCFKCGTCILCDNCRIFCADAAIRRKPDHSGYEILYDYCKGCGVCVEECPRGAIHLRRVPAPSVAEIGGGS